MNFNADFSIYFTSVKSAIAYRFTMMLSILTGPLTLLVNYVIWNGVFKASGKTVISGFTFDQMVTYIVISFITVYLTWDDIDGRLADGVREGSFATFLLKPISFLRYEFVNKLGHRTLAFLIEYIPVFLIMNFLFGFKLFKTNNFFVYLISLGLAFTVSFFLSVLLGILAFWVVKPQGLMRIYNMLEFFIHGTVLPLSLFPDIIQKVFFFLPFQFVAYVPATVFIGNYNLGGVIFSSFEIILYGLVQILILFLITLLLWKISIKRFCGVGT